jgi:hypothetical protein
VLADLDPPKGVMLAADIEHVPPLDGGVAKGPNYVHRIDRPPRTQDQLATDL